jgi:hypothetical protein
MNEREVFKMAAIFFKYVNTWNNQQQNCQNTYNIPKPYPKPNPNPNPNIYINLAKLILNWTALKNYSFRPLLFVITYY